MTANSATPPIPRPARRARAAAEHPALTFAPPTAAQAIVLLALLALPSVLLALLRRRGRAAAPAAPAQGETGAPKLRTPRRFRAPRAARRPAAEPGALWAARTLAHTDTPAVEVARRTGLSQDAVLLLRRAAGARAEEAAGGGRNVRAAVPARGDGSNAR
ncbi:MAG: hypothetical protein IRZ00_18750 [Gemmatimonadetes bacterium]|nr:hypothetical protein [Gemmatimonadota bacterium]